MIGENADAENDDETDSDFVHLISEGSGVELNF